MAALFSDVVVAWYRQFGRKDLPWQQNPTAYRVWVSEIMLQQTQVATVIDYYQRFMQVFPDVQKLAGATSDEVLSLWSGLGYYARARNLHKTAQQVVADHGGEFPDNVADLETLPGIGRSTAGAITSFAYKKPAVILDGNVKRVLARVHAIKSWTGETQTLKQLWEIAEEETPQQNIAAYNQAMMDLGAMICTRSRPSCEACPLTNHCQAFKQNLQNDLPLAKPKKTLPEREGRMLVLLQDDTILLHKRPSPGIWGGLWCFPEYDAALLQQFNIAQQQVGEVSSHTFSHYRWHIRPEYIWVKNKLPRLNQDFIWYNPDKPNNIGLAAIVKHWLVAQHEEIK